MTTTETIKEIFSGILNVDEEEITPESTNNDLGMDSLDKTEIVMSIEKEYHIDITASEFDGLKQFSHYVEIVERKVNA